MDIVNNGYSRSVNNEIHVNNGYSRRINNEDVLKLRKLELVREL